MMQMSDEPEPLNEGVDRKQLTTIKQAFLAHNQEKYARTLAGLSPRQQQFFKLLPLLFHVNHPMLPGYLNHHTPSGVYGYTPSEEDLHAAKNIARSFTHSHDLLDKPHAIDALFIMGSLGSIAHSESSDIDVWVCYNNQLDVYACGELKEKCLQLTHWAAHVAHIEANFFLMDPIKFNQGQQVLFSSDASGSAQHFLLLDEFYRTAIWLSGKLPLWWFVPAEHENNYANYSNNLLEKRFIRALDVIDFGGIPYIPENEFIGAGVWQLYKAIDAPYKSVLKLLLLECYANEHFGEPLSLTFKRKLYLSLSQHSINTNDLDSYVLVYQRLESYLIAQNQLTRLELVRRCFYFKAGKNISKPANLHNQSWQRTLLETMVSAWGWHQQQVALLDGRVRWKSQQVLFEYNLLANELNQSYRFLLDMQKNIAGDSAITGNELLMLGRKLHAAFERKAGKIDWINPTISQDLSEKSLCFVQIVEQDTLVWKIYPSSQQDFLSYVVAAKPIKRSRNFIEAFLWCYCNNILVNDTKIDILSKHFTLQFSQLQHLHQCIKNWLPLPLTKPTHEDFIQNPHTTRLLLLFNVGIEPQAELLKKGIQILSNQKDAFSYSGLKENLVITTDIIHSNSWGEIVCRHFGSDALVNCLLYYLRLIPPHRNDKLPEVIFRCLSLGQGNIIEQRVIQLWRSVLKCFYAKNTKLNTRFIFEMAGDYFLLQFIQQQPQIFCFKSYEKLLEKLSAPQLDVSAIVVDDFALNDKPLRLIAESVKTSAVHMFYKIDDHKAYISIVDYKGSLFTTTFLLLNGKTVFSEQSLLRALYFFLRCIIDRQLREHEISADNFNDLAILKKIHIFEIKGNGQHKNAYLEQRNIELNVNQLPFINICAMAEPIDNLQLRFTIFCEGKEFSELEFGADIYTEVARYILSCRHLGERYPCYITDLDLSLCREYLAPQAGLQLIHYLQIKNEIEQKLTVAIQNL